MAVSPDLLEILACPVCLEHVTLTADSSGLRCAKCRRIYPIRKDIPIMLVDEARIEGPVGAPSGASSESH